MLNTTKNISISGTSSVDKKTIMTFTANIPSSGDASFSKRIMDKKTYLENQEECDADYANFEAEVTAALKEM